MTFLEHLCMLFYVIAISYLVWRIEAHEYEHFKRKRRKRG